MFSAWPSYYLVAMRPAFGVDCYFTVCTVFMFKALVVSTRSFRAWISLSLDAYSVVNVALLNNNPLFITSWYCAWYCVQLKFRLLLGICFKNLRSPYNVWCRTELFVAKYSANISGLECKRRRLCRWWKSTQDGWGDSPLELLMHNQCMSRLPFGSVQMLPLAFHHLLKLMEEFSFLWLQMLRSRGNPKSVTPIP